VRACRRGCLARRRRVYQRTTHPHPPLAFTDFFASLFALPLFALPTSTDAAHPPPHPPPLRLPSRHRRIADACRLAHTTLHPPRRVAGPRRPPPPPLPASTHAVASRTDPRCKPPYLTLNPNPKVCVCVCACLCAYLRACVRVCRVCARVRVCICSSPSRCCCRRCCLLLVGATPQHAGREFRAWVMRCCVCAYVRVHWDNRTRQRQ
jgi:hypothetical protein